MSAWEIAALADVGRLRLDLPADVRRLLETVGVEALPLDCETACRAYRLPDLPHRDPDAVG